MNKVPESIVRRMMCAAVITVFLPLLVSGQQQDRVVDWHPAQGVTDAEVLELVDIKVGGESVRAGQPFAANEDWLDTLTFRIRNVSGKTIRLFAFGVAFPELDTNGFSPGFTPAFFDADSPERNTGARKTLPPGEEIDVKLPADQVEIMRRVSMRTFGTANLNRLNLAPGLATFEDGSRIAGFSLRRRDHEKH